MSFERSASVASILSFVLPGLGQLSLGAGRRGVLMAVPAVGVVVAAGGGAVLASLLRPETLIALLQGAALPASLVATTR